MPVRRYRLIPFVAFRYSWPNFMHRDRSFWQSRSMTARSTRPTHRVSAFARVQALVPGSKRWICNPLKPFKCLSLWQLASNSIRQSLKNCYSSITITFTFPQVTQFYVSNRHIFRIFNNVLLISHWRLIDQHDIGQQAVPQQKYYIANTHLYYRRFKNGIYDIWVVPRCTLLKVRHRKANV